MTGYESKRAAAQEKLAQPAQGPVDMEVMAASVHDAYLTTCDLLGWGVKPENRVPYSELTEDSKELDRASVRAVLRYIPPPQRKPLTQDGTMEIANQTAGQYWMDEAHIQRFRAAVEAAHGIKE